MKTYRCTRASLYLHDCIGRTNLNARQGHYVEAENEDDAREQMKVMFPKDNGAFTIDVWREDGEES